MPILNVIKNSMSFAGLLIFGLLAGFLIKFSFPPYGYYAYILIPYFLLFWGILKLSGFKSFLLGLVIGCGWFFFSMSWVYGFADWVDADFHSRVFVINTLVLLYLAFVSMGLPALVSSWILRLTYRKSAGVVIPVVFIWFEWLRSVMFTGFPFMQPGYLLVDTSISALAPVFGVLGMTAWTFFCVGALVNLFFSNTVFSKVIYVFTVVLAFIVSFYLAKLEWSNPGEKIHIRLIHGASSNIDKEKRYKQSDRLNRYLDYSAKSPKVDLIVWPEGTIRNDNGLYRKAAKLVKAKIVDTDVYLGGYTSDENGEYNAIVDAVDSKPIYKKQHLVPLGEYTPNVFAFFFRLGQSSIDIPFNSISSGLEGQNITKSTKYNFAAGICFEIIFGDEIRNKSLDSEFFIHVSDLAWFQDTPFKYHMLDIARVRAIELAKPIIRSTNLGITSVINHKGKVLKSMDKQQEGYLDAVLIRQNRPTPYSRFGDWPVLVFSIFLLTVLFFFARIIGTTDALRHSE